MLMAAEAQPLLVWLMLSELVVLGPFPFSSLFFQKRFIFFCFICIQKDCYKVSRPQMIDTNYLQIPCQLMASVALM